MKRWQLLLGILISALFLWLALSGLRLTDVWSAVRTANYWWILPGVGAYMLGLVVRAWRWHYLLRPLKSVSTSTIFPIVTIGYMGNNIYPARIGEILRAYVLKRKEDISISASLATIIVERIFDGVVMLGFVIFNLPTLTSVAGASGFVGSIQQVAIWGTAAFGGVLLVFLLTAMFPNPATRIFAWLIEHTLPVRLRPKVQGLLLRFLEGLGALRSPRDALMVFFTSIIIWLLETVKYWFVMQAFSFTVSFFALMLMNGIVNLATTIPSAPGYIGTFDAPGIAVLEAFGVEGTLAAAYTLVLHAALWLPPTLLGLYYFGRESLSWQEVRHWQEDRSPAL